MGKIGVGGCIFHPVMFSPRLLFDGVVSFGKNSATPPPLTAFAFDSGPARRARAGPPTHACVSERSRKRRKRKGLPTQDCNRSRVNEQLDRGIWRLLPMLRSERG